MVNLNCTSCVTCVLPDDVVDCCIRTPLCHFIEINQPVILGSVRKLSNLIAFQ